MTPKSRFFGLPSYSARFRYDIRVATPQEGHTLTCLHGSDTKIIPLSARYH